MLPPDLNSVIPDIDISKGGYTGDYTEEKFKPITSKYMDYWWHFREVLRSSQDKNDNHWRRTDSQPLTDNEYRILLALSMTNYLAYTGIGDAIYFYRLLKEAVNGDFDDIDERVFEIRRNWKACYSSLYSAVSAVCNIVCEVYQANPKKTLGNFSLGIAKQWAILNNQTVHIHLQTLEKCLEVRSHLDHYWAIWISTGKGAFLFDSNFHKGYIALSNADVNYQTNALQRTLEDVTETFHTLNLIYKEIVVKGKTLDSYLIQKGWEVDYSDYGFPHNGQRPQP